MTFSPGCEGKIRTNPVPLGWSMSLLGPKWAGGGSGSEIRRKTGKIREDMMCHVTSWTFCAGSFWSFYEFLDNFWQVWTNCGFLEKTICWAMWWVKFPEDAFFLLFIYSNELLLAALGISRRSIIPIVSREHGMGNINPINPRRMIPKDFVHPGRWWTQNVLCNHPFHPIPKWSKIDSVSRQGLFDKFD